MPTTYDYDTVFPNVLLVNRIYFSPWTDRAEYTPPVRQSHSICIQRTVYMIFRPNVAKAIVPIMTKIEKNDSLGC